MNSRSRYSTVEYLTAAIRIEYLGIRARSRRSRPGRSPREASHSSKNPTGINPELVSGNLKQSSQIEKTPTRTLLDLDLGSRASASLSTEVPICALAHDPVRVSGKSRAPSETFASGPVQCRSWVSPIIDSY